MTAEQVDYPPDTSADEPDLSVLSMSLMSMLLEVPVELRSKFASEIVDLRNRLVEEYGTRAAVTVLVDEACGALLDSRYLGIVSRSLLSSCLSDPNLRRAEKLDGMADRAKKRLQSTLTALERLRPRKAAITIVPGSELH